MCVFKKRWVFFLLYTTKGGGIHTHGRNIYSYTISKKSLGGVRWVEGSVCDQLNRFARHLATFCHRVPHWLMFSSAQASPGECCPSPRLVSLCTIDMEREILCNDGHWKWLDYLNRFSVHTLAEFESLFCQYNFSIFFKWNFKKFSLQSQNQFTNLIR